MGAMKRRLNGLFFAVLAVIFFVLPADAQEEAADFKYFACDNGLRVVLSRKDFLPLVNIALAVDMGSKNESDGTSGLVHILEHMILFRGSKYHSGIFLGEEIRRRGGYFNGHTDRDLATFEISLPAEQVEFGLEVLKELVFDLKLTQEELNKEKEIILEEIRNIEDDPDQWGEMLALQQLFKGHPYGRPIYGEPDIIAGATVETVRSFYRRCVIPANCALAVVGRFQVAGLEPKIKEIFGSLKKGEAAKIAFKEAARLKKNVDVQKTMDIEKSHLVFAFAAPPYNHDRQLAMRVLTQILGGGIYPMLGRALRGRRRLVEGISMRYIGMKYGGAVIIHLTLEQKNIRTAKTRLLTFFKEATRLRYALDEYLPAQQRLAFDYLGAARNQIHYRSEEFRERGINAAVSYARYLLLNEELEKEDFFQRLAGVKAKDLRRAASDYLAGEKYVMLSITPGQENRR
jgi:zinc protease